ncbi:unnamed protein product [Effrenium voratum]|nr:unnamed protein product [Effrenium voratum]
MSVEYGWAIRYAPPLFKCTEEVCVEAMKTYGLALEHVSPQMRGNVQVVKTAVTQCGMALLFAPAELRRRRDVVMKAIQNSGLALEFAHPDLKKDQAIVYAAMQKDCDARRLCFFARRGLREAWCVSMEVAMEDLAAYTWHWRELLPTAKQELQVCRQVWVWIVVYFVVMEYCCSIFFRNLGFQRYRGLEVYAEQVAPHYASALVEHGKVQLVNGSQALPLAEVLKDTAYSHGWNVSVPIEAPRTNLSALGGMPFNLRDWSQENLPDYSQNDIIAVLSDVVAGSAIVIFLLVCMLPLVISFHGKKRPYIAAMALRTVRALFLVHFLRVPTYLATTIPGACAGMVAKTVVAGRRNQRHLQTVWDLLVDTYNWTHDSNCGDLIFSGHAVTTATLLVASCHYAGQMLPARMSKVVNWAALITLLLQVFLIVTVFLKHGRMHLFRMRLYLLPEEVDRFGTRISTCISKEGCVAKAEAYQPKPKAPQPPLKAGAAAGGAAPRQVPQVPPPAHPPGGPGRPCLVQSFPHWALSLCLLARGQRMCMRALGSPWEVLGVQPGASSVEVKRAYRRKALKEHPDVSKRPDAKQRWQELSAAYDVLNDPEKLKAWERAKSGAGSGRSSGSGATGAPRSYNGRWRRTQEMEEQYDAGGDSFSAIFSDLFQSLEESASETRAGRARRAGGMLLEDLLEFLEKGLGEDVNVRGASPFTDSNPEVELQETQLELKTMQSRDEVLRYEADAWERKSELCRDSGDKAGELDAMQRSPAEWAWEQANARVEALRAQAAERQDCPVLQAALAMSLKDQSAAYDHFQRQLSKSTEPPVKKVKEELDDGEDSRSEAASDCPSLRLKRRVRLGGVAISGSSRRGSFLWKIVQAARRRLKKSIKEEGNSDDEPDNGRSESYVRKPRQVFILRRAQQDVKEWDPGAAYADVDQVLESWVHLLELRDARTLLWAHERISSCFRHGEHQGRPVASLVTDLRNGLDSMDIMPLVGVEDERGTWVISGNRRLHALRTWALECEGEVLVRILVHKHGKDIPQSLFAKYVEASTSRTGGWPEVGGACGWQRSTPSAKASPAAVQDQGRPSVKRRCL